MTTEFDQPGGSTALQALVDRAAITDCLHRYARGVDRRDRELLATAYWPDAVEDHGAYIGPVDGLLDFLEVVHERFAGFQRHITNTTIELDGDTAHVESYYLCVLRPEVGTTLLMSGGRYVDRFERRAGEWRILRRVVVMEWDAEPAGGAPKHAVSIPPADGADDVSAMRPLEVERPHRRL